MLQECLSASLGGTGAKDAGAAGAAARDAACAVAPAGGPTGSEAARAAGVAGRTGGPVLEAQCVAPSLLEVFFATPSVPEAEHLLRELDWGQHFVGVVMSAAVGEQRMYVYSLKEAVQYLYGGTAGLGFASGSKGSVCWYDTDAFIAWARDMLGDKPLAAALADAYEAAPSHHEAVRSMGVIVAQRYRQLQDVVDAAEDSGKAAEDSGGASERAGAGA